MRKALVPMLASLALCGAATIALVATTAKAEQSPKHPVMLALATPPVLTMDTAAPPTDGGPDGMGMGPGMMPGMDGPMGGTMMPRLCKDMVARQTGELAYLESKLALTASQAPLYARWKGVELEIAQKHATECLAMPARKAGERPTMLDGMAMEEKMLKMRLANLEAERPALTALYGALTPEQKMELGRAARHKMEGRMHMMMGMMGPHDGMGPGMMERHGRGPDGPYGHMGPPPPPAQ
jgi:hypothetical protein